LKVTYVYEWVLVGKSYQRFQFIGFDIKEQSSPQQRQYDQKASILPGWFRQNIPSFESTHSYLKESW